jgi:hypothetical protein
VAQTPQAGSREAVGKTVHVEAVIKMLDPAFNLRRIAVKRRQPNPWVQAGHGLPSRRGCPQGGRGAADGAGDCGAGLGRRQYQYKTPDRGDLADLIGTIHSSPRNHEGMGVQRINEGSPARWCLAS